MAREYGIRTLLMTDVVGSTRLWSAHPSVMPAVIERMEALAADAVAAEGGQIVKRRGEGDSLFCTFPAPAAATRSALALVVALGEEPWPEGIELRVRAAIHCGPAHERDGDLMGPMPNRCARLREVGHGDQILLSGAARSQIEAHEEIAFRDLGRHRLRDLDEPESIWQLLIPGRSEDHPPLRSLTCLRNNLPTQYTSFVGRESLRQTLLGCLQSDRLTTLTGAGGSGKTRLALQLGAETIEAFPDGVWFVELANLTTEATMIRAIGDACGHRDLPDAKAAETLAERLRLQTKTLFVLDNAEHALNVVGRVTAELLAAIPDIHIIVTSREPLHLRGERVHRVPPLTVPPVGCESAETVGGTEAGALFLDRARLRLPEFILRDSNAKAVGEIVRRLDGIPLCLEMAASHVGYLGPDQIAARLNDRFALLEGDEADVTPRHRTMRETIAWQYEGLAEEEKLLLQRLAAFSGHFDLAAAEAVGGAPPLDPDRVLRYLRALIDKSLVVATPDGGAMTYRLLETIAQYASEEAGDNRQAMNALLEWCLKLASEGHAQLYGSEHARWVAMFIAAEPSIRRALDWGIAGKAVGTSTLVSKMTRYWYYRGRFVEGRTFLQLALPLASDPEETASLQNALAVFCTCLGDLEAAAEVLTKLLARDDISCSARATYTANLATTYSERGQLEEAAGLFREARAHALECGSDSILLSVRYNLGLVLIDLGRLDEAIAELSIACEEYECAQDITRCANCCVSLSGIYASLSDFDLASKWLRRALATPPDNPSVTFATNALLSAAWIAISRERWSDACYFLAGHIRTRSEAKAQTPKRSLDVIASVNKALAAHASRECDARRAEGMTASLDRLLQDCRALVSHDE